VQPFCRPTEMPFLCDREEVSQMAKVHWGLISFTD
jgi:hypothetical protein